MLIIQIKKYIGWQIIRIPQIKSSISTYFTEVSHTTFLWQKQKLQLSPGQCCDFYAHLYGMPLFPSLTAFMSSGPIIAMTLARDNAIAHWKSIIGPVNSTEARETHPGWSVRYLTKAWFSLWFSCRSFLANVFLYNGERIDSTTALAGQMERGGGAHKPGLWSISAYESNIWLETN